MLTRIVWGLLFFVAVAIGILAIGSAFRASEPGFRPRNNVPVKHVSKHKRRRVPAGAIVIADL